MRFYAILCEYQHFHVKPRQDYDGPGARFSHLYEAVGLGAVQLCRSLRRRLVDVVDGAVFRHDAAVHTHERQQAAVLLVVYHLMELLVQVTFVFIKEL